MERMRSAALALLAVTLAALAAGAVAFAAVDAGTVAVNRGAVGIKLGMRRAAVVDALGPPIYQNANGYMQYSEDNLFDVYLNGRKRVRMIGISGEDFCLRSGLCMFTRNGVKKLRAQFGGRLKEVELESGETVLVVRGRFKGHRVFTAFTPTTLRPRGRIIQIFIGRCPPRPAVCGA
jgi:hypothetical protein